MVLTAIGVVLSEARSMTPPITTTSFNEIESLTDVCCANTNVDANATTIDTSFFLLCLINFHKNDNITINSR